VAKTVGRYILAVALAPFRNSPSGPRVTSVARHREAVRQRPGGFFVCVGRFEAGTLLCVLAAALTAEVASYF
jgi:hypothetical protein